MQIFKFGGASVNSAKGIRQVASIVKRYSKEKILVVVSAMGKTTNALERVIDQYQKGKNFQEEIESSRIYHENIMRELFKTESPIWQKVAHEFDSIPDLLKAKMPHDQLYDQVVSIGEIVSTLIVCDFIAEQGLSMQWLDARKYIITDETFREGKVDWTETDQRINTLRSLIDEKIILTQGFIGGHGKYTITLGRDGSDYTAAIFASCLHADSVTIWKDVPGVMNADPRRLPEAVVFEELPFREAAEMTYYGASVIHPKTIKPLANNNIPLYVKNFDDPSLPGTIIHETKISALPPLIVFKDNQCLVSCRVTDYTFINEEQLSSIFKALSELNIKINVMQNSAISFSFCIDFREDKVLQLTERLSSHFEVYYNTGLTLITVKNYDMISSDKYRNMKGVLLEQLSRSTLQVLVKN
ncbi:MAG: aspartate kinase [Cyclobacteriaceae bacterium]|nr:aspartate kinase [Cyclobacteriaceae bacterium]